MTKKSAKPVGTQSVILDGEKIDRLCIKAGIDRKLLAQCANVSYKTILRAVSGKAVRIDVMRMICTVLNVAPVDLQPNDQEAILPPKNSSLDNKRVLVIAMLENNTDEDLNTFATRFFMCLKQSGMVLQGFISPQIEQGSIIIKFWITEHDASVLASDFALSSTTGWQYTYVTSLIVSNVKLAPFEFFRVEIAERTKSEAEMHRNTEGGMPESFSRNWRLPTHHYDNLGRRRPIGYAPFSSQTHSDIHL